MRLLDRYVLRNFLEPLLLCCAAFVGIWLIFDLSSHGAGFISEGASADQIIQFYSCQLPQIALMALPVAILLALLFSLSKMSRSNEIIGMLGAGISLGRILRPLILAGVAATVGCMYLNYELAPQAEAMKRQAMDNIRKSQGGRSRDEVHGHLFRDRLSSRTWFVRKLKLGSPILEGVQVVVQDEGGNPVRKWYAARAIHEPVSGRWILQRGMIVSLSPQGEVIENGIDNFEEEGQRILTDWRETPWRIASSRLDPQQLTVPELDEYLVQNADFPRSQLAPFQTTLWDRWALPCNCLLVVFLAGPLSIVYSRRGLMQGITGAILLFFLLTVLRSLFLALGKGEQVRPEIAAWGPQLAFLLLGLLLLWMRSGNRDFSNLFSFRS
jgi:lipopolysaccharide export system permease protein